MTKAANSLPRKTIVLETGFVNKGTIVPLSNSLDMLFMGGASTKEEAKRRNAVRDCVIRVRSYRLASYTAENWRQKQAF